MTSTPRSTTRFPVGKVLTSIAALLPAVGAIVADWNETHVFNPKWPPHAKFHNAQTISLASALAAATLWASWRPGSDRRSSLRRATALGGLYWFSMVPAYYFPGAGVVDPDSPVQPFRKFGIEVNQITLLAAVEVPLLAAGYVLEARRIDDPRRPL